MKATTWGFSRRMNSWASASLKVSPRLFEADEIRALTLAHFADAIREITVGKDGELRARLDEVCDARFHPGTTSSGNHHGDAIGGAVGHLEKLLDVAHDLEEVGIEVADDRLGKRFINARMNHAWSRDRKSVV